MMETDHRPLEIDMLSANDLTNINFLSKMDVYIVSSISSDRRSIIERTPVDKRGGTNPKWMNFKMKFYIDLSKAQKTQVNLNFQIISRRILGDKTIGYVHVPVKALLDEEAIHEIQEKDGKPRKKKISASYQVNTLSGKAKGTLCFMYNFGEKFKLSNQDEGYNYGTSCQECACNYNLHLPITYNFSNVDPKHHSSEYPGTKFSALFRPIWLLTQIKM